MSAQADLQLVRWQDLHVRSELEYVMEIAQQNGWKDCEIFGYGSMISQPVESMGWKLIPADLYEYSIPAECVTRVHKLINAGVRIRGIIIADDIRGRKSIPHPAKPALPNVAIRSAGEILLFIGKGLLWLVVAAFVIPFTPLILLGFVFDPKLIILVEDGEGNTVWLSIFTWYE